MTESPSPTKIAQPFSPVKPDDTIMRNPSSDSMIHHNSSHSPYHITYKREGRTVPPPYGVSPSQRVLSPSLFIKKYDRIRDCLRCSLGMAAGQREVTLRLLRLWAYYGQVYPKESQVTELPGCSKATFWRTVQLLEERGLVQVINRYVCRPHAQISNLYRLDKLILVLARYLAEHGVAFRDKWLTPYLTMPGRLFWGATASTLWPSGEP